MASGNAGLGCGTRPSGPRSALVKTATTPGAAAASDVSIADDAGVGVRRAHVHDPRRVGQLDVLDVRPADGEQPRVLDAHHPVAEDAAHGPTIGDGVLDYGDA